MVTLITLIDPKTDGAIPLRCEVTVVKDSVQIECKGDKGFIIQVPTKIIVEALNDDLHG